MTEFNVHLDGKDLKERPVVFNRSSTVLSVLVMVPPGPKATLNCELREIADAPFRDCPWVNKDLIVDVYDGSGVLVTIPPKCFLTLHNHSDADLRVTIQLLAAPTA